MLSLATAELSDHAIGDVNAWFARVKGSCASLDAPATPSNGRLLRQCSRWTTRPSLFGFNSRQTVSHCAIPPLWISVEMWIRRVYYQGRIGAVLDALGGRLERAAARFTVPDAVFLITNREQGRGDQSTGGSWV